MGIRGIIRDIVGIYLGFEILKGYLFKNFTLSTPIILAGLALLILGMWFILERLGILPKL